LPHIPVCLTNKRIKMQAKLAFLCNYNKFSIKYKSIILKSLQNMSNEETKLMIQEYAKNPINNYKMEDATISQHEGNFICGDDITIYIKIKDKKIKKFSFDWNCSNITMASASFLAEILPEEDILDILNRKYKTLTEKWFIVSNRRKQAACIWLLAVQNAILNHTKMDKRYEFDDIID